MPHNKTEVEVLSNFNKLLEEVEAERARIKVWHNTHEFEISRDGKVVQFFSTIAECRAFLKGYLLKTKK